MIPLQTKKETAPVYYSISDAYLYRVPEYVLDIPTQSNPTPFTICKLRTEPDRPSICYRGNSYSIAISSDKVPYALYSTASIAFPAILSTDSIFNSNTSPEAILLFNVPSSVLSLGIEISIYDVISIDSIRPLLEHAHVSNIYLETSSTARQEVSIDYLNSIKKDPKNIVIRSIIDVNADLLLLGDLVRLNIVISSVTANGHYIDRGNYTNQELSSGSIRYNGRYYRQVRNVTDLVDGDYSNYYWFDSRNIYMTE